MPTIQLPDDQYQRLTSVAHEAGYSDVQSFIASFTEEPSSDSSALNQLLNDRIKAVEHGDVSTKSITDIKREARLS